MLENDHPGSIGKILKNLLVKVTETPIELTSLVERPIDRNDKKMFSNYGGISDDPLVDNQDKKMIQNETFDSVKECKFSFLV
jgi:hypothetical protein